MHVQDTVYNAVKRYCSKGSSQIFAEMKRRIWRKHHILLVCACLLITTYFGGKYVIISNKVNYPVRNLDLKQLSQSLDIDQSWNKPFNVSGPKRRVFEVNCKAIINGNKSEIKKGIILMANNSYSRPIVSDSDYIRITDDCDDFISNRGYNDQTLSREELEFPLAYSILLYQDVEQAERLLRAIYKPQNYYCLHVDADSDRTVHQAVEGLAGCFDNIFVVTRKEYIVYAGFTRLQADLNCMSDLLHIGKKWTYFINLPSQEFPIKSNQDIVKILKVYNGANDIEGITGGRTFQNRYKFRFIYKHVANQAKPKIYKTSTVKDSPPYNVSVVKGSAYGVFSREFVEFVTENRIARELLDWFRDVYSPDEYYWATLHHNPHIGTPGAYKGKGKPDVKPWLAAYAAWGRRDPCAGKLIHGVCVFGLGDLQHLVKLPYLFANKFHINYQPLTLSCMEEWFYNRTFEKDTLNLTYYRNLPFIYKKETGR